MDKQIIIPETIRKAAEAGAAIAVSISGGKDSQALLIEVVKAYRENGWTGQIFAIYADLGRMAWKGAKDFVRALAAESGVPLVITKQKDLVDHIKGRWASIQAKGESKPFWPSSGARYCTSDTKRDPINTELRAFDLVISVEGVAAYESTDRAEKPVYEIRGRITAKRLADMDADAALEAWKTGVYTKKGKRIRERLAFDWRPIHQFARRDVWKSCGTSSFEVGRRRALYAQGDEEKALEGAIVNPAYIFGNRRFSCALCVLATDEDIRIGAKHNPEIAQELVGMEDESGYTFKNGKSLREILGA